jgi:hypothetical protein
MPVDPSFSRSRSVSTSFCASTRCDAESGRHSSDRTAGPVCPERFAITASDRRNSTIFMRGPPLS